MPRKIVVGLLLMLLTLTAWGAMPALGQDVGVQPTELLPPEDEIPVLYPPQPPFAGEATVVVFIDDIPVSVAWQEVRSITTEFNGWVSSSTSGLGRSEGVRYEYVTAIIELPDFQLDGFIAWINDLGRLVIFEHSAVPTAGSVVIEVTLTDAVEPFIGSNDLESPGRVDRALDTAGDVLLTMLSVLIVAGAVIAPIGLMAVIVYFVWRGIRRRWPITEAPDHRPEPADAELIES